MRELADTARSRAELLGRLLPLVRAPSTMVASCASTTRIAPSAPSCRPIPTPRPKHASMLISMRSPLRATRPWTSVAATSFWGYSTRRVVTQEELIRGEPTRPRRDAASSWSSMSPWPPWWTIQAGPFPARRRARAPRPDRRRDGAADLWWARGVAVDDDVGHTMYEGRARRFATGAQRREVMRRDRHCRFPGCTNVSFTNVHHTYRGNPGGGPTSTIWSCSACFTTKRCTARAGRCRAMPIGSSPSSAPAAGS